MFLMATSGHGVSVGFGFTVEDDGDLASVPFATVTVSDDVMDQLRFEAIADTEVPGTGAGIPAFGDHLDCDDPMTLVGGTNSPLLSTE